MARLRAVSDGCGEGAQPFRKASLLLHAGKRSEHPLGRSLLRDDALLDDAQIPLDVLLIDLACAQPLTSERQDPLQDEASRALGVVCVEPHEVRVQAETGRGHEVAQSVIEVHPIAHVPLLVGQRAHQPEPERRVGHLIEGSGS